MRGGRKAANASWRTWRPGAGERPGVRDAAERLDSADDRRVNGGVFEANHPRLEKSADNQPFPMNLLQYTPVLRTPPLLSIIGVIKSNPSIPAGRAWRPSHALRIPTAEPGRDRSATPPAPPELLDACALGAARVVDGAEVKLAVRRMHCLRGRRQAQAHGLTWPLRQRLLAAAGTVRWTRATGPCSRSRTTRCSADPS